MIRFRCRHCGSDTGTSDSHVCGRCACLPVAERGRPREPGDDDLATLIEGCEEPDRPAPAPTPTPDAALLTARLDEAAERRLTVWLQGRISLLSRCRTFGELAQAQPR